MQQMVKKRMRLSLMARNINQYSIMYVLLFSIGFLTCAMYKKELLIVWFAGLSTLLALRTFNEDSYIRTFRRILVEWVVTATMVGCVSFMMGAQKETTFLGVTMLSMVVFHSLFSEPSISTRRRRQVQRLHELKHLEAILMNTSKAEVIEPSRHQRDAFQKVMEELKRRVEIVPPIKECQQRNRSIDNKACVIGELQKMIDHLSDEGHHIDHQLYYKPLFRDHLHNRSMDQPHIDITRTE